MLTDPAARHTAAPRGWRSMAIQRTVRGASDVSDDNSFASVGWSDDRDALRRRDRRRPGLSEPTDSAHHAIRAGREHDGHGPSPRRALHLALAAERDRRQPWRRQHHYRYRDRREVSARRLHDSAHHHHAFHSAQCDEDTVRPGQGFRAGCNPRNPTARARAASRRARQHRAGADRSGQVQSGATSPSHPPAPAGHPIWPEKCSTCWRA